MDTGVIVVGISASVWITVTVIAKLQSVNVEELTPRQTQGLLYDLVELLELRTRMRDKKRGLRVALIPVFFLALFKCHITPF